VAVKPEGQSSLGRPNLASWLYETASEKCRRGWQSRASVARFIRVQGLLCLVASSKVLYVTMCWLGTMARSRSLKASYLFTCFLSPPLLVPCSGVDCGLQTAPRYLRSSKYPTLSSISGRLPLMSLPAGYFARPLEERDLPAIVGVSPHDRQVTKQISRRYPLAAELRNRQQPLHLAYQPGDSRNSEGLVRHDHQQ
jgi:hypothetical protein